LPRARLFFAAGLRCDHRVLRLIVFVSLMSIACGGQAAPSTAAPAAGSAPAAADDAAFGPLEYGADYQSYTRVNKETFQSPTHGRRFVDIYVNDVGLDAYRGESEFPVGTVIVKSSWESEGETRTDVAGPLFVMVKKEKGFDPEHSDWWYGFHWESVPEKWAAKLKAKQIYWRSPSSKVDYCWKCHDSYDREVGMPPADKRDF
jgi:hypothetical protein